MIDVQVPITQTDLSELFGSGSSDDELATTGNGSFISPSIASTLSFGDDVQSDAQFFDLNKSSTPPLFDEPPPMKRQKAITAAGAVYVPSSSKASPAYAADGIFPPSQICTPLSPNIEIRNARQKITVSKPSTCSVPPEENMETSVLRKLPASTNAQKAPEMETKEPKYVST